MILEVLTQMATEGLRGLGLGSGGNVSKDTPSRGEVDFVSTSIHHYHGPHHQVRLLSTY